MTEKMIKIGKMAELVSVTPRTLRYYEQRGLIRPTSISPKGYRYYSMDVLPIIEKIKELQSIGLALEEIKEVIGLFSQQSRRLDAKRKMLEFMQSHLDDINGKLNLLTHMRTELSRQIRNTRRRLNQLSKGKRS